MKTGLRLPLQGETRQARSSLGASQPTRSELPGYRPVLLLTDLVPALGRAAKKGESTVGAYTLMKCVPADSSCSSAPLVLLLCSLATACNLAAAAGTRDLSQGPHGQLPSALHMPQRLEIGCTRWTTASPTTTDQEP